MFELAGLYINNFTREHRFWAKTQLLNFSDYKNELPENVLNLFIDAASELFVVILTPISLRFLNWPSPVGKEYFTQTSILRSRFTNYPLHDFETRVFVS